MTPSQTIAGLLHECRDPGRCTADKLHELSAAVRGATDVQITLAVLGYIAGMLESTKCALLIAHDAQTAAESEPPDGRVLQ